jgi:transcriptional regulator with XRE-family HTH domain
VANVPPLRRRRVAGALRRLRAGAGMSMDAVAEATGFDKAKISRTERAEMGITGDVVLTLCAAYGVDKDVASALAELARQSRRRSWWHDYSDDISAELADLLELETDANSVNVFTIDLIPGLNQTREYTEAFMRLGNSGMGEDQIRQLVDLRMERQVRAREGGTRVWAVIGETALTYPVGGGQVMAAQLDHIADLAEARLVTVQVLPLSLPGHASMGVPFTLFHLRDGATFAFLDTLTGALYLEEQVDIDAYQHAWTQLTANALDFHKSVSILRQKAREHRS